MLIIFYFPSRSIVDIENIFMERGLEIKRGVLHIIEYAILSFLLYRALIKSKFKKYSFVLAVTISIFYGLIDEVHQIFVVGRYNFETPGLSSKTGSRNTSVENLPFLFRA